MTSAELTARRERLGLSLTAFAAALGVHFTTAHRWEKRGPVPVWLELALEGLEARHSVASVSARRCSGER